MSQELLYTSAPHGLKPGSRGFCTVLSTQGMPAPLAAGLEALSGYRPVFPPSDSRAHLNPAVLSHVTLTVAGRAWHVLSRIADYGLDYSQRTNKLAHHVVVDPGEKVECGPAQLLGMPGFMRGDWDNEPRLVAPKPIKKMTSAPPGICRAWKEITGDAGWAGVLAESYLREPERPVFLLYEPGQDVLPLIAEALSLLPPERRWEVTFSTYFTGLPQGVGCAWRCMLKDSPEAHQSRRFVKALRIDLTSDQTEAATGGALVELARKGQPPAPLRPSRAPGRGDRETQAVTSTADPSHGPDETANDLNINQEITTAPAPPALTRNAYRRKEHNPFELLERDPGRRTLTDVHTEQRRRSRRRWLVTGVVAFSLMLLGAVGFMGFKFWQSMGKAEKGHAMAGAGAEVPVPNSKPISPIKQQLVANTNSATTAAGAELKMQSVAKPVNGATGNAPALGHVAQPAVPGPQKVADSTSSKAAVTTANPVVSERLSIEDEIQLTELLRNRVGGGPSIELKNIFSARATEINIQLLIPETGQLRSQKRQAAFIAYDIHMPVRAGDEFTVPILAFQTDLDAIKPSLKVFPQVDPLQKQSELGWCVAEVNFKQDQKDGKLRLGFIQEPPFKYGSTELRADGQIQFSIPDSFKTSLEIELIVETVEIKVGARRFAFVQSGNGMRSSAFDEFLDEMTVKPNTSPKPIHQWRLIKEAPTKSTASSKSRAARICLELTDWRDYIDAFSRAVQSDASKSADLIEKHINSGNVSATIESRRKFVLKLRDIINLTVTEVDSRINSFEQWAPNELNTETAEASLVTFKDMLTQLRELQSATVIGARIYYKLYKYGDPKPISRRYLIDFKVPQ